MTPAQHDLLTTLALIVREKGTPDDRRDIERRLEAMGADHDESLEAQEPPDIGRLRRENDIMRSALLDIRAASIPDQPATSGADEVTWVTVHVAVIRRLAEHALNRLGASA